MQCRAALMLQHKIRQTRLQSGHSFIAIEHDYSPFNIIPYFPVIVFPNIWARIDVINFVSVSICKQKK